jgi:type IV secretion system protein VirB10
MTLICDLALIVGISIAGICSTNEAPPDRLPPDDPDAWSFMPVRPVRPVQPAAIHVKEDTSPPVLVSFPPVVITKTIELARPERIIVPPQVEPEIDYLRMAVEASYKQRRTELANWPSIEVPKNDITNELKQITTPFDVSLNSLPKPPSATKLTPPVQRVRPGYEAASVTSGLPIDNSRIVTADRYITGILETGINSQLDGDAGGEIIIQTSRDTYGYHGRNVLIPKGSRLICDYKSPELVGSTRLAINCKRILLAGHRAEIYQLSSTAGDVQGRSGITGNVDNRFWEKYGTAFILSGISTAVRIASSMSDNEIAANGSEELSEKFGEITASVLEQTVNLAPIITVPQGTRIQIRPRKDWYIREVVTGYQQAKG